MGGFKRHIDLEHCVHNKCMFDHDQLISHLIGKSVSIDVFVNSLIGAIKLSGRTGITLMPQNITQKLDMHQLQLV